MLRPVATRIQARQSEWMPIGPLCPLVLSMLERHPLPAHAVARGLGGSWASARTTLDRLGGARLVRRRPLGAGEAFTLTARGRRELELQRLIWLRAASI